MASVKVSYAPPKGQSETDEVNASVDSWSTAPRPSHLGPNEARARSVRVTDEALIVELEDGRGLTVPLTRFPRLIEASERERAEYELIGDGTMIHWPAVDEDVDVPNLLRA
jgi:Protein of unknown function (DUF2442)